MKSLSKCLILLVVAVPTVLAAAMYPPLLEPESEAYRQGREALDRRDWGAAQTAFRQAVEVDDAADAALYWLAYAQVKGGRTADALATLGRLEREYPRSAWRDDAEALRIEVQGRGGRVPDESEVSNDELKLMALAGLAHSDPERALPMVERILRGDGSTELKEQALFVAGQMGGERGRQMLLNAARSSDEELQESAIQYLAMLGGEDSLAELDQLFRSGVGEEAQEAILEAYMIAGAKDRLLAAARSDASEELRSEAVQLLGVQGATAELWELYQSERSTEVKEAVLEGMMISGQSGYLSQVARDGSDPELQETALQLLGVMGEHETLLEVFATTESVELKEEIVQAVGLAGRLQDLETIAVDSSQPTEVREQALSALGVHGGSEALWRIYQSTGAQLGEGLLEGLALADQGDRILAIVRDTSQPVGFRSEAMDALVIVGPEPDVIGDLYRSLRERDLREGALELLFTTGAAESLAEIARNEKDTGLRAKAVELLGLTGSPLAAEVLEEILSE